AMAKMYDIRGKARLNPRSSAKTDDHGEYRIYDLAPGRYYLKASGENGAPPFGAILYPNGHEVADANTVTLPLGEEVRGVNMTLGKTQTFSVQGQAIDAKTNGPLRDPWINLNSFDMGFSTIYAQGRPDGTF